MTLIAMRRDNTTFPAEVSLSFIEGAPPEANNGDPTLHHPSRGGLAVAFITDVTERQRLEATAREHARQIQALSASLLTSQEDERRRLARELHDGLCQHLAFLSIQVGALAGKSEAGDIRKELKILQARAGAAADMARHLAHQLHPSSLDDLGLVISLQSLCEEFSTENNIPVRFASRNVPRSVSRETASCFYRITEQSLRNVIQHSGAAHVSVDLSSSAGVVILSVEDDGTGFDPEKVRGRGSLGLTGMQERARLLSGTLCIASRPGRGTRIKVEVPFREVPR
jgi:signal transduction histidine kinase